MRKYCPVSCRDTERGFSSKVDCKDLHPRCPTWAELGECKVNSDLKRYCPRSCGTCANQKTAGSADNHATSSVVNTEELCVDKDEECPGWAVSSIYFGSLDSQDKWHSINVSPVFYFFVFHRQRIWESVRLTQSKFLGVRRDKSVLNTTSSDFVNLFSMTQ